MVDNKHFLSGRPVRISKVLRDELEAAIQAHLTAVEKLTAVLDHADGDPYLEPSLGWSPDARANLMDDLEPDAGDEPEITWRETYGRGAAGDAIRDEEAEPSLAHTNDLNQLRAQKNLQGTGFTSQDAELEAEHDGKEPSLGSRNCIGAVEGWYGGGFDQTDWAGGDRQDLEDQHDGREPDVDDEPKHLPVVMS